MLPEIGKQSCIRRRPVLHFARNGTKVVRICVMKGTENGEKTVRFRKINCTNPDRLQQHWRLNLIQEVTRELCEKGNLKCLSNQDKLGALLRLKHFCPLLRLTCALSGAWQCRKSNLIFFIFQAKLDFLTLICVWSF